MTEYRKTFTFENEGHTLGNLLVQKALKDKDVILAAYNIVHPLLYVCNVLIVSKKDPDSVMKSVINSLIDDLDDIYKQIP